MRSSSILRRMTQLVDANAEDDLDQSGGRGQAFDELTQRFADLIAEGDQAIAQTVAGLRLLEDDLREAQDAALEWGDRAKAAAGTGGSLRPLGQISEADRFDELALVALRRQISYEQAVGRLRQQVGDEREHHERLKDGLLRLRRTLERLTQGGDGRG